MWWVWGGCGEAVGFPGVSVRLEINVKYLQLFHCDCVKESFTEQNSAAVLQWLACKPRLLRSPLPLQELGTSTVPGFLVSALAEQALHQLCQLSIHKIHIQIGLRA